MATYKSKYTGVQVDAKLDEIPGKMDASTYDQNNNGIVDNSEKLGDQLPAHYAKQNDLETTNTNVSANTTNITKNANAITQVNESVNELNESKVSKINGKQLSTNDYTNTEKNKLSGIAIGANKTLLANNLTTTNVGKALDATKGKELDGKITLLNASLSEVKENYLEANKVIYVSPSGSDTNDGSQSSPFKTINYALSTIPKNLNGFAARINIATGVYSENVSVNYFESGYIDFYLNGDVSVNGNFSSTKAYVLLNNSSYELTVNGRINAYTTATVRNETNLVISPNDAIGMYIVQGSSLFSIGGTVAVNNTTHSAIVSAHTSKVYLQNLSGNNNTGMGLNAQSGGVIAYGTNTLTASTAIGTSSGGRVYTGAQTSTPNY